MGKIYFIVLDGAADRMIPELDYRTPLEAASTPCLDNLASQGEMALIRILPSGYVPETDSGLMALLGYEPMKYYHGRGILEAIGRGLYKDYRYFAGFRANFASYDADKEILERRTARGLSQEELQALAEEIVEKVRIRSICGVDFDLVAFGEHRGILSFYSNDTKISGNVSNTDPGFVKRGYFSTPVEDYGKRVLPCVPLDREASSCMMAAIVNEFTVQSHEVLEQSDINRIRREQSLLPCNWIILRDGGSSMVPMDDFYEKYHRNLSIYGELPCEKALAELIHADFSYSREFELQLSGRYLEQLSKRLVNDEADIVFCHIKGPDEHGHDHDPRGKMLAIEKIDRFLMNGIMKAKQENDMIVVTCDHATPCVLGIHSEDKVPLLISGSNMASDGLLHFDEKNASKGSCQLTKAVDVMGYLVERSSVL